MLKTLNKWLTPLLFSTCAALHLLFGPPEGAVEVNLAIGPAVALGISLGASALSSFAASRNRITRNILPIDALLPAGGFGFLGGKADPFDLAAPQRSRKFKVALSQLVDQLSSPDLSRQVLGRQLASVSQGFSNAQDASNRTAALLGGPARLSPAAVAASRGAATGDVLAQFELQNQENRRRNLSLLFPLLSFFASLQGAATGTPTSVTTTTGPSSPIAAGIGGALGGLGAGFAQLGQQQLLQSLFSQSQGGPKPGPNPALDSPFGRPV